MLRIDIYCGLLGVGKTTLIRRMLETAYKDKKVVILENEIGKVGYDTALLRASGISVREITSGCVCCTMTGSFVEALEQIQAELAPDIVIIEPTGAADMNNLLEVLRSVPGAEIGLNVMLIHAGKILQLLKVVGDFYTDQIRCADLLFLNFIEKAGPEKTHEIEKVLLGINPRARVIAVPMDQVDENTFLAPAGTCRMRIQARHHASSPAASLRKSLQTNRALPDVTTHELIFDRPWTGKMVDELNKMWKSGDFANVWRVKGILSMEDGSLLKYDVSFGDSFQEKWQAGTDLEPNHLILIGKEFPPTLFQLMPQPYREA